MAAGQTVSLVDGEIVRVAWKEARDLFHFGFGFIEVRLKTHARIFAQQRVADFEHRVGGGKSETRRHGVEQSPATVEFADQSGALAVGAVGRLVQCPGAGCDRRAPCR